MISVDLEMSGIYPAENGIWQIGAYDLESKKEFLDECRIDDEDKIEKGALIVTGKTEKELRAAITLNAIKVDLIGITAEAVNLSSGRDNTMIIVLVVVLISVNVGWFVYFKRKEKIKAQTQGNHEQK